MYIFIESLTGLRIRLKVVSGDTIKYIKYRIMICEDLSIDDQHLIYQEQVLENGKTLKDYNVPHNATIRLIMKLRGGPLSTDIDYDESLTEENVNAVTDQLALIYLENGYLKYLPVLGLDMQSKFLKQTKNNLCDPSIFTSYKEPLTDQKLTILKLKMDCVKLGKKLSNMSRMHDSSKTIRVNKDGDTFRPNKPSHSFLHRSVSLDSRRVEFINHIPNSVNVKYNPALYYLTQSPFGMYRTMSALDTIKLNKSSVTLPPIPNSSKINRNFNSAEISSENQFFNGHSYESKPRLPTVSESEYESKKVASKKSRCLLCSRKLSLSNEFACRCGGLFCTKHKYPEEHNCKYDFKYQGKLELRKSNPMIINEKIAKI